MTIRVSVSPDADGIIRIKCGDTIVEIDVVSPNPGIPPIDFDNPAHDNIANYRVVAGTTTFKGLEDLVGGRDVTVANVDMTQNPMGALARMAQDQPTVDLVRLGATEIDIHAIATLSSDLQQPGAPPVLFDLQTAVMRDVL